MPLTGATTLCGEQVIRGDCCLGQWRPAKTTSHPCAGPVECRRGILVTLAKSSAAWINELQVLEGPAQPRCHMRGSVQSGLPSLPPVLVRSLMALVKFPGSVWHGASLRIKRYSPGSGSHGFSTGALCGGSWRR